MAPEDTAPDAPTPPEQPAERLISIPYLLLRVTTAGGAFIMGFVQTFVFARVLPPDRFSIFIVIGGIGYSLWVTDLGLAKILFVNLRAGKLAGKLDPRDARQASAVITFYVFLGIAASLICIVARFAQPSSTFRDAVELGLFLLYITLNLAWYSLRSISIAVDLYLYYEKLELTRRVITVATMLALLGGLPLIVFLAGVDALWGAVLIAAVGKLIARGAMAAQLRGWIGELVAFYRSNSSAIARSGTSALSGVLVATFPYYFVPLAYGLGPAPIILELTFRIFRGSSVIYAAACDLTLPAQTRALAARDAGRLLRTTLLAIGLCAVPAAAGCAALAFAAEPLFHFLLRSAASVPLTIAPILIVLLLVNIVQIVAEALLQHTGYFRHLAYASIGLAVLMAIATVFSLAAKLDIIGFLATYATVFTIGTLALAVAAVMGPIHAAFPHDADGSSKSPVMRSLRNALQSKSAAH